MVVTARVTVRINEAELDKRNHKAKNGGRAAWSAVDVVEAAVSDALKHNFITTDHDVKAEVLPDVPAV
jgi:hypothetical protein